MKHYLLGLPETGREDKTFDFLVHGWSDSDSDSGKKSRELEQHFKDKSILKKISIHVKH